MYRQHFGLTHAPLGKQCRDLWDDGQLDPIRSRFQWLLDSPGLGLLTGEAGVGKTAVLRRLTETLSPHRYQVIYLAETDFGRVDLYRNLALALGLEPAYRRAQLWRDIKKRVHELYEQKQVLPELAFTLNRAPYSALASRIQVRLTLDPVLQRDRFHALIQHALKEAGSHHNLLADTAIELLCQASQGRPRLAGSLLCHAMRLACEKGLNHLPDELIQQAIEEQRP